MNTCKNARLCLRIRKLEKEDFYHRVFPPFFFDPEGYFRVKTFDYARKPLFARKDVTGKVLHIFHQSHQVGVCTLAHEEGERIRVY